MLTITDYGFDVPSLFQRDLKSNEILYTLSEDIRIQEPVCGSNF